MFSTIAYAADFVASLVNHVNELMAAVHVLNFSIMLFFFSSRLHSVMLT
jgi:hypothetical protein